MIHVTRWKIFFVGLALVFGLVFTLPNVLTPAQRNQLPGFLPHKAMNLGLDLQGGSYLMMQVDTNALIKARMTQLVEDVRSALQKEQIGAAEPVQSGSQVSVVITDPSALDAAYDALRKLSLPIQGTAQPEFQVSKGPGATVSFLMTDAVAKAEGVRAVDQSMEIIRRRIDPKGTSAVTIARQGVDRIVIQAPGQSDPEVLKRQIGTTAKLTFQLVDQSVPVAEAQAGHIPPGSELLPMTESRRGGETFVLVKKRVLVSGEDLKRAQSSTDQFGRPDITFAFNGKGAAKFADVTIKNVGHPFAIVLDKKVISAPNIDGAITGGTGEITGGNFTVESAKELADLLQGGALPAPLRVEQQRTVGPELGADAIKAGTLSTVIGFVAIVIFVFLAYGALFGGVSIVGLIINGLLITGAMSMIQATLTLPGIAGLILTLAVAVDANVLIFERAREESRAGRTPIASLDAGFSRAFVTILDANLTTMTAAIIMFSFGAGPVQGFGVTLAIGVITSVFSSVVVSGLLLGWWLRVSRPKTLPIE